MSEPNSSSIIDLRVLNACSNILLEHIEGKDIVSLDKILYLYEQMIKSTFNLVSAAWDKYESLDDDTKRELNNKSTAQHTRHGNTYNVVSEAQDIYDKYIEFRKDKNLIRENFLKYIKIKDAALSKQWLDEHPEYGWFKNIHNRKKDYSPRKTL